MVQPYVPHVLLRLCVIGALAHTGSIGQEVPCEYIAIYIRGIKLPCDERGMIRFHRYCQD